MPKKSIEQKRSYAVLLWGYAVACTALTNYFLLRIFEMKESYWIWLSMPIVAVIDYYLGQNKNKKIQATSYISNIIDYIWRGFLLGTIILVSIIFLVAFRLNNSALFSLITPLIMVMNAISSFLTAMVLRYKSWLFTTALFVIGSIIAAYLVNERQFLVLACTMFIGFIIPGHIANNRISKNV